MTTTIDPTDIGRDKDLSRAAPFLLNGDSGTACLLIHGLTSTPFEVRELGEALHAAGHTVSGPLLPGHGRRLRVLSRIRWTTWTNAVAAEWERLVRTHERVIVGGSSMGAALALWLASERPVHGVIGLGTPYRLRWPAYLAYALRYVRPILPKAGGSSIADPIARRAHPSYVGTPMHSIVEMLRLLRVVRGQLADVRAPVLLVHAWNDPVIARASPLAVYDRVQSTHKKLIWVHRSAHIVTEDYDKELVFSVCTDFLTEIRNDRTKR